MLKKVIAVVLIVLAAGAWLYLDHLNKQEQLLAEQARQEMIQARAEAAARAAARAKFEAELTEAFNTCKATADQAKETFLTENRKPVRRKPGEFTIPEEIVAQAEDTLIAAYAECQQAHDTRYAQGN
ncbi:MAG: hypothetical protein KKG03_05900 [Gammaproteobacteria bacterium]|nr:hypothetical protein [Sideroxydans sp.]MBU3903209.1 hypothetical protein [Gammaproteobacteria bacterium]MBU4046578.1 hypothetical protein [Gammaproteobacteria bacterium]MBU4151168.1 hypothetical protein [Gammaproteobacteria bacterium]